MRRAHTRRRDASGSNRWRLAMGAVGRTVLAASLVVGCASSSPETRSEPAAEDGPETAASPPEAPEPDPAQQPAAVGVDGTYLRPNLRFDDGELGYVHVRPEDMPLRVAIGYPKRPPKYAGRKETRERAIQAMRMWEAAIRPLVPWFELAFVERDPDAAVQVEWKRKITGPWGGFGGWRWWHEDGALRVGGQMEISTTPSNFVTLEIDEVVLLVAHEFGHVLGLGHCLDCDSAMNYAWNTRERIFVTELDARTFAALVAQPIHPRLLAGPDAEER